MHLLPIPGAEIYYEPQFFSPQDAADLFNVLLAGCAWQRRRTSFGHPVPRDEAYYGDPGTQYTYSRREYKPRPWTPELFNLKSQIEQATPAAAYAHSGIAAIGFNAVLCNLYRDGNDSVGLHADAEPEMGPVIASLSLGAERLFRVKRKDGTVAFSQKLPAGSLLIMAGTTQNKFKHEVPKEPRVMQPRINLTFRHIEHK
jgi:alkylated DNA repair dioxygenase AlkB